MIKLSTSHIVSSVKMEHILKSRIGNGTFELIYGTAESTSRMEKR
jgi:hypothetical protein